MAGSPIQPSIDAYGRYARATNLADHLELLALVGQELNRASLADLIIDRSWVAKMDELFKMPAPAPHDEFEEGPEDGDGATADQPGTTQANRVFDVLDERSDLLGDLYPFVIADDVVRLRPCVEVRASPYLALLAITLAHAHTVEADAHPTRVLEEVVTSVLDRRGLRAVNVGDQGRGQHDFCETVRRSGVAVGLQPTPHAAVTFTHANEEGVDALAHFPWGDVRPGAWAFIGQATCGKSDNWIGKIWEPVPEMWKLLLNIGIRPLAFLAVPHHVEPSHLAKLVQDTDRLVLDRIRLTHFRGDVSADEKLLMEAVIATGVEALS